MMTDAQLYNHLRAQMARSYGVEYHMHDDNSFRLTIETKEKEPLVLSVDSKCRYWIDGGIIGSREFVSKTTTHFRGQEVAIKHHQAHIHGQHSDEGEFFSFHRLKSAS